MIPVLLSTLTKVFIDSPVNDLLDTCTKNFQLKLTRSRGQKYSPARKNTVGKREELGARGDIVMNYLWGALAVVQNINAAYMKNNKNTSQEYHRA